MNQKTCKARCGQCRRKRKTRRMVRTWIGPTFERWEWRCMNAAACWFRHLGVWR